MKSNPKISRRNFIQRTFKFSSVFLGIGFIGGCGRKEDTSSQRREAEEQRGLGDSCDDLSNIGQSEIAKREIAGYVEKTPYPQNRCDNCNLYTPPSDGDGCGGCVLFEGPVFAAGYCDHWAPEK